MERSSYIPGSAYLDRKERRSLFGWLTCGCVSIFLLSICAAPFLFLFSFDLLPDWIVNRAVARQERNWRDLGIDDYEIDVQYGSIVYTQVALEVRYNVIVNANGELTSGDDAYKDYTIDGQFKKARNCRRFCNVTYDPTYHFPRDIVGGFIESWGISVLEFRPLESDNTD